MSYAERINDLLTPLERRVFKKLDSPQKIQDYLDKLPINFGETQMSPRAVLKAKKAHCMEAALLAAAALAYHGQKPLLMDFQTAFDDEDHVLALFKQNGHWGAISKTNHAIIRWRDPIYRSPRELAMSYAHEYYLHDGRKSLRAYSAPFDLRRHAPERWVTANKYLFWLEETIDRSKHFPVVQKKNLKHLRKASGIERAALKITEWSRRGKRNYT